MESADGEAQTGRECVRGDICVDRGVLSTEILPLGPWVGGLRRVSLWIGRGEERSEEALFAVCSKSRSA